MAIKTNFTNSSPADDFVRAQGQEPDIKHSIENSIEHSIEPSWDFSSLGFPQPSRVYSAASFSGSGSSASNSLDISGFVLSGARFVRLGEDLLIISGDESILIASYFSGARPAIWSAEFGFYSAELIASFLETRAVSDGAGDGATGEKYALGFLQQLFTSENSGTASIGVVESAKGDVQVTREGVVITLIVGDVIMLNDIISTGDASEVFLRFADKMEFRLGSEGRLAIDEFIYDEMSSDGTQILSIISGAFSYASGLIAGKDPTSVELKTPYGTIGIRGTKILGNVEPIDSSGAGGNGGGLSVTILEGRVALLRDNTEVADISSQFETLIVRGDAAGDYSYDISTLSVADVISSYDFLEGSLEQLEEVTGSSLGSSISSTNEGEGNGAGSAISGDFSIASETVAEAVELSFVESSSLSLAEAAAEADADADDEEDSITEVSDIADISGIDDIVEPINSDLRGGEGNDVLTGTAGVDRLYGEGGRDELSGLGGNDELYGGADDDILVGGVGNDLLVGGAGRDEYQIRVGDGVDIIREVNEGGIANEVHFRSSASGSYAADDFSASVFSKVGNDLRISLDIGGIRQDVTLKDYHLYTGRVFELYFVSGTDEIPIPSFIVVPTFIIGTSGDDTLTGTSGVDIFDGGAGEDTVSYANSGAGVRTNLTDYASRNTGDAAGDSYKSIENIIGSTNGRNFLYGDGFNNKLTGGNLVDELYGGGGKDTLTGGRGNDIFDGGAGNDVLEGGAGIDNYYFNVGDGIDRITDADGGGLLFRSSDSGNYGASDLSPSSFARDVDNLVISLTVGGVAQKVTIVDYFSNGGTFTLSYNLAEGGAYSAISIPIIGTAGDDTLIGTAAADVFDGGAGEDTVSYASSGGVVKANLANVLVNTGDATGDSYTLIENLRGATNYGNILFGDVDNNKLTGGNLVDGLYGGAGNDLLYGGAGIDTLAGGAGNDILHGGVGVDDYYFNVGDGIDRITDADGGGLYFNSLGTEVYVGSDFSPSIFSQAGQDLVISLLVGGVAQSVTIVDYFSNTGTFTLSYNTVQDGVYKTLAVPTSFIDGTDIGETLNGTVGVDIISGLGGNDVLRGEGGDDVLDGGTGVDEYYFRAGDGTDLIIDSDGGKLFFSSSALGDYSVFNVSAKIFTQVGQDLRIDIAVGGVSQRVTIENYYDNPNSFSFSYNIAAGDAYIGLAVPNIIEGTSGGDTLSGSAGVDIIRGFADNDVIEGGTGDDVLDGGEGSDVYIFNNGDGNDIILDDAVGKLWFKDVTSFSDFTITRGDVDGDVYGTEFLIKADGMSVIAEDRGRYTDSQYTLTYGSGTESVNIYAGLSGGANVMGSSGRDWLGGTINTQKLYGGDGDDFLDGGIDRDVLVGGKGDDIFLDTAGDDQYYFNVGDGNDRITDSDGGKLYFESGSSGNYVAGNFVASSFTKIGQNLQIDLTVGGISQQVTIVDYYNPVSSFSIYYDTSDGGTDILVASGDIPT